MSKNQIEAMSTARPCGPPRCLDDGKYQQDETMKYVSGIQIAGAGEDDEHIV